MCSAEQEICVDGRFLVDVVVLFLLGRRWRGRGGRRWCWGCHRRSGRNWGGGRVGFVLLWTGAEPHSNPDLENLDR